MSSSSLRNSRRFTLFIMSLVLLTILYSILDVYQIIDKLGYAMFTVQTILYLWNEINKIEE
ncbi:MAG: hypothetical protein ACTSW1_05825 [Candidatus Hodarchaeales archaeon]